MALEYNDNVAPVAAFTGRTVDNFVNPKRSGHAKLAIPGLPCQIQHLRVDPELADNCFDRRFYALRKLRALSPRGRFALDGGTALAFLAP